MTFGNLFRVSSIFCLTVVSRKDIWHSVTDGSWFYRKHVRLSSEMVVIEKKFNTLCHKDVFVHGLYVRIKLLTISRRREVQGESPLVVGLKIYRVREREEISQKSIHT